MTFEQIDSLVEKSSYAVDHELVIKHANPHRKNYYRFLYLLCKKLKAKTFLEIGTESGYAAKLVSKVCHSITLDIQHYIEYAKVTSLVYDSANTIARDYIKDNFGKVDVIFQDSSHHYLPSKTEWELYKPLLKKGGVWVCDDITPSFYNPNPHPSGRPEYQDPEGKGMVQYFEELPGEKKLYKDVLHYGNTQGVII